MKISVLLSLFEKENPNYFDLSMKSIWNDQIRKPDQIVLVEDGPITPQLDQVVNKWKREIGDLLTIVKLKDNQGLAIALNEGSKYCTGDYIARMDTDDISLPNRFQVQENYLLEHKNVVLLGGGMIEFNDEEGDLTPRIMPLSLKEIKSAICKTNPFVHPSVFISKKIFDKGLKYNSKCRRNQDAEFWFRIIAAGYNVANVPDIIIKFRKDPFLYKKRKKSAKSEFYIFMKGIYQIYGLFTYRYIFPIVHYLFRLIPASWSQFIYKRFILKYWQRNTKLDKSTCL